MSKRPKPTMKQVAIELVRLNMIVEELVKVAHPPQDFSCCKCGKDIVCEPKKNPVNNKG